MLKYVLSLSEVKDTGPRLLNKMLSYRREPALQGALQFSPKVEDWNLGDNILRTL